MRKIHFTTVDAKIKGMPKDRDEQEKQIKELCIAVRRRLNVGGKTK